MSETNGLLKTLIETNKENKTLSFNSFDAPKLNSIIKTTKTKYP